VIVSSSQPAARQVRQGLGDLVRFLAEAEDQVGLVDQPGFPGQRDDLQRPLVTEAGPDPLEEPRHGLELCPSTPAGPRTPRPAGSLAALKSGISSSTPQPGTVSWISRAVCAYSHAPPSGQVVPAYPGHGGVAQAHGGDRLRDPARLVGVQRLRLARGDLAESRSAWLHWSPADEEVASRSSQHSKMFGQPASSHTVCRPSRLTRFFSAVYSGPVRSRVLIHGGFLSMGGLAVACFQAEQPASFGCEYHPFRVRPGRRHPCAAGGVVTGPAQRASGDPAGPRDDQDHARVERGEQAAGRGHAHRRPRRTAPR